MADLLAAAKTSIAKHFSDDKPSSFGIVYRSRNNPYVTDRDAVIRDVAALVPVKHKVDLKSPDYVILIEVFKVRILVILTKLLYRMTHKVSFHCFSQSAAAITIMDNYYKLHKLNPFLYVKEGSGKQAQAKPATPEPTTTTV